MANFDIGTKTGMSNKHIAASIQNAPVVHITLDSLTAGSGATAYNTHLQNNMRGIAGFGGLYLPFASFMQFAPDDYAYNQCVLGNTGSGRKWVDDLSFTDPIKVNSINGLGAYFDGTQPVTGSGVSVFMKFKYQKIRLFYRQQVGGGTFKVDQPTYGQSYASVDTSGAESLKWIDIDLYREDAVNGVGTSTNTGYNLRIIDVAGIVQLHGCLILTGENAPVIINSARAGRLLKDYVKINPDVRRDFLTACGVTHSLFNAGTNDAPTTTPENFEIDLRDAIAIEAQNVENVTIVIPNLASTNSTSKYRQNYIDVAADFGAEIYDIPSIWGDYNGFVAKQWMIDATHPNDFFNRLLGRAYSNLLINGAKYQEPEVMS